MRDPNPLPVVSALAASDLASEPYLLAAGAAEDPIDLEMALCAQLLRAARGSVHALRRELAAGADLGPLRAELAAARATCAAAMDGLEPAYLRAQQHRLEVAAQRERHAAFVAGLRARLVCIGADEAPAAWSHLGWEEDDPSRPVALARGGGQLVLAAGVQGSGKSVFGTVLAEGAAASEPLAAAALPPTATIFFHIEEHDRLPQLLDGLRANPAPRDLEILAARLGVSGAPIVRLRLAVPPALLPALRPRLQPYEDLGLEVRPLRVRPPELGQPGLEALLGADDGARFVRRMLEDAQDQGAGLTVPRLRRFVDEAEDLNAAMRRAAHARLRLLEEIAAPPEEEGGAGAGGGLWSLVEPGVVTVVYLGGPHMGHGRVAPLLVGLLGGLLMPSAAHGPFHRVITVDEVNLLARDEAVWPALVRTARLVRHRAATLLLMGQDLLCVPDELFGLAGVCAVFQQRSPRIFEHIRERTGALRGARFEEASRLRVGEALIAATHASAPALRQGYRRVQIRPPRCLHGGFTRAVV